jgi:ion channel-forming bestrophin family protein
LEIPMVIAIATTFFLIEKMTIHLQDPFENRPTDTPVTAIARTIERNLNQMLGENKETAESLKDGKLQQKLHENHSPQKEKLKEGSFYVM